MRLVCIPVLVCAVVSPAQAGQKKIPTSASRPPAKPAPVKPTEVAHQIPQTGPLGEDDLIEIGRLKAKTADDKFSEDPSVPYIGREIVITVPKGDISIDYDTETHALTAATYEYMNSVDLKSDTTTSEETGQNAYGAKASFAKIRGNNYGFWLPRDIVNPHPAKYTTTLPGPEARLLGDAIRLRLYGVIAKADGIYAEKNSAFFKKSKFSDATIGNPVDQYVNSYYLSISFNKAEWIDARTGAVIAQGEPPR